MGKCVSPQKEQNSQVNAPEPTNKNAVTAPSAGSVSPPRDQNAVTSRSRTMHKQQKHVSHSHLPPARSSPPHSARHSTPKFSVANSKCPFRSHRGNGMRGKCVPVPPGIPVITHNNGNVVLPHGKIVMYQVVGRNGCGAVCKIP